VNVYLCCLQSPNRWNIPSYGFWLRNFKPALEEMGCRVFEPSNIDLAEPLARCFDPDWLEHGRARLGEALLQAVKEAHRRFGIQLFFSYFYSAHVEPGILEAIRDLGIPVVNFFCDNLRQFESVRPLARSVTLNWVPEREALPLYRSLGAPALHLAMGVHPGAYRVTGSGELRQVTFVGSGDHLRMQLLEPVLETAIPLRIYGQGWGRQSPSGDRGPHTPGSPHEALREPPPLPWSWRRRLSARQHLRRLRDYGLAGEWRYFEARRMRARQASRFDGVSFPPLPHDDFVAVTARSAVTLGINRCPHPGYPFSRPLVYSRLRDVEAPSMGACYLTESCVDLESMYDLGTEIETYRDAEELVAKAEALLGDAPRRRGLRSAGRQAVLSRHTWGHRFRALFRELGLQDPLH